MKLITVTVPCYNSQDYMEACVDSLLVGGERVEIIIIDDGSKDNTAAIADRYAEQYPGIVQVIHQENGGHGEGINQGLLHATGVYFKVVDSDDKMSEDFPAFLDALEECEKQGGVDIVITNYYYVHSDGKGDRSINYSNCLPENRIFGWKDTKPFRIHELMTIHSSTFRTETMKKSWKMLPKHTFYEDNLMVAQVLPNISRLYYRNSDLYRYTIGREGQSVQQDNTVKRYDHQVLVSQLCFMTCHLSDISEPMQRKYIRHELFMMFAIACCFARLRNTPEADRRLEEMWQACYAFDAPAAKSFRKGSALWLLNIRGAFGRGIVRLIYRIANNVVRFN